MTELISVYHVFTFESLIKAQDVHQRIIRFVTSSGGAAYEVGRMRAVILAGPPETVYLSPGAMEAARTLWIDLPTGKMIKAVELPKSISLIFGESSDLPG